MDEHAVALVTGSSNGIGAATAVALASLVDWVVVHHRDSAERAEAVAARVRRLGSQCIVVQADLAQRGAMTALLDETRTRAGQPSVLVNNAGVSRRSPLATSSLDDFDETFQVNVRAPFVAMQDAARAMPDGGTIVNIASGATVMSPPTAAMYAASKAALHQLTRVAARELGQRGITVNTVSPGFTQTGLLDEARVEKAVSMTPLGRVGTPDEVAAVVAFLAKPEGRWITGQDLHANGGIVLR